MLNKSDYFYTRIDQEEWLDTLMSPMLRLVDRWTIHVLKDNARQRARWITDEHFRTVMSNKNHKRHVLKGKGYRPPVRYSRLGVSHKFTGEMFDAMIKEQGGICLICGTDTPNGRGWVTDHDHKTGIVRGVLCGRCNSGLGMFKDDIGTLNRAIEYLQRSCEGDE